MHASPGVASLLIRDFYCIISPASVSFYTVQWHFMLSVNTCLYKVVCCWGACRDNSRHAGMVWARRRKLTYGTAGTVGAVGDRGGK